jgi:hypothetical protein
MPDLFGVQQRSMPAHLELNQRGQAPLLLVVKVVL